MSKVTPDMTIKDIDDKFWRAVKSEQVSVTPVVPAGKPTNLYAKEASCRPPNYNLLN